MIRTDIEPSVVTVGELRDLWRKLRVAVPAKQWGFLNVNPASVKKARQKWPKKRS
jgi:hypothetical protein